MLMRIGGVLAVVLILSANRVEATMIDSFDAGPQSLAVGPGQTSASGEVNPGTDVAIGGYRDLALQWSSGGPNYASVFVSGSGGNFCFTQGTATGNVTITWIDRLPEAALSFGLSANLTAGGDNEFVMDVREITGTGLKFSVGVYTDATHYSEYSGTLPSGTSGNQALLYSSLSQAGVGPADFAARRARSCSTSTALVTLALTLQSIRSKPGKACRNLRYSHWPRSLRSSSPARRRWKKPDGCTCG